MALFPKSLLTNGLLRETLGSRGVRLETDGLIGGTGVAEVPGFISLIGNYVPFVGRYWKKTRRKT